MKLKMSRINGDSDLVLYAIQGREPESYQSTVSGGVGTAIWLEGQHWMPEIRVIVKDDRAIISAALPGDDPVTGRAGEAVEIYNGPFPLTRETIMENFRRYIAEQLMGGDL